MGFLTELRSYLTGPLTSRSPELARLWSAPSTSTGVGVSERTALNYSAFWACVNAIATDAASLPLIPYKRVQGGGKERHVDSKLYKIIHDEPNPEMTSFTMRQILTAHVLVWGNGYAEIERDGGGRPLHLWPITPDRVTPGRSQSGAVVYGVTRASGPDDIIPAADMLHIPGLGFDGLVGYSIVAKARESIGLGLATERFGGTFFGNGATFGGVISYAGPRPTELSDKNYRETLESKHQGVERAHKLLALYNGAKYERMGIPPNDAQFLETRRFQIEEQCRWFRMPPHKIQHLERSTNNNIEHQGIEYYTDTLRPWLVRWEQEINRKLIPSLERRFQFVEHMIEGVLRGDLQSRYNAYAVGRNWGWLCADDIAERENMNPLPNGTGKVYLVPSNMVPADRLQEVIDAQVKPPPTAQAPAPDVAGAANANRALDAIRTDLVAAQVRAEAHLTRAVQAEDALGGAKASVVASSVLQTERDEARAAHQQALRDVAVQQALLIEATQRADRAQAELDAADAFAKEVVERHAETSKHHVEAVEARERADAARSQAEAAAAAARAAVEDRDESLLAVQEKLVEMDGWVPPVEVEVREVALAALRADVLAQNVALAEAQSHLETARVSLTERDAALHDAHIRIEERDVWVPPADLAGVMADMVPLRDAIQSLTIERDAARDAVTSAEARLEAESAARVVADTALAEHQSAERQRLADAAAAHRAEVERLAADRAATAEQLDAARVALAGAEQQVHAAGQAADALTLEQQRLADELTARRADVERLTADVSATLGQRDAAQMALAQAEARAAAEAAARAAAETAGVAQQAAERQRMTAVIGAHRGLIADAMGRMIRRETEKARRAQATPEKLRAWIDSFYPVHEDICRAALLPAIRAHLAWTQSDEDPSIVTEALVTQHVAESQRQLRMVLESDGEDIPLTLETTLRRWELERADHLADVVLREAVNHVAR